MIITVSGFNGAGKSSTAKTLAKELGWEYYGMGLLMRADAQERDMSMEEHDRFVANNPKMDRLLDERVKKLGELDNIIVDGRAAWHFIPHSKKVFFDADERVRAKRAASKARGSEEYASVEEAVEHLSSRVEVLRARLENLYGIDVYDPKNFDLVVDTTNLSIQETVDLLRKELQL